MNYEHRSRGKNEVPAQWNRGRRVREASPAFEIPGRWFRRGRGPKAGAGPDAGAGAQDGGPLGPSSYRGSQESTPIRVQFGAKDRFPGQGQGSLMQLLEDSRNSTQYMLDPRLVHA